MKKLIIAIGVAALMLATAANSGAQCSPNPPTLSGFNHIDGYVVQAMIAAPKGMRVDYQITLRRAAYQDGSWRQLKVWRVDGLVYGPVPIFKRHKYILWARVVDPCSGCASQVARFNF